MEVCPWALPSAKSLPFSWEEHSQLGASCSTFRIHHGLGAEPTLFLGRFSTPWLSWGTRAWPFMPTVRSLCWEVFASEPCGWLGNIDLHSSGNSPAPSCSLPLCLSQVFIPHLQQACQAPNFTSGSASRAPADTASEKGMAQRGNNDPPDCFGDSKAEGTCPLHFVRTLLRQPGPRG